MFPMKSQEDRSEFRLCSKKKYGSRMDRQDANRQHLRKTMRTASNLRGEAVSGLIIVKG